MVQNTSKARCFQSLTSMTNTDPNSLQCQKCQHIWPLDKYQPKHIEELNDLDHILTFECPNCHEDLTFGIRGLCVDLAYPEYSGPLDVTKGLD